jgi:hypothetical protein
MPYFQLLSYVFLFFGVTHAHGQIYLQYEKANSTKVTKYGPGQQITFKTIQYPEYWLKGEIYKILPDEKALVFDDRITYLKDITHFRYYRTWPKAIGTNLMRFGAAWFLFAGIIEGGSAIGVLETNYKFGTDTAIIGGTALIGGFLTRSLWGTATKPINGHNRLIIIDLRF